VTEVAVIDVYIGTYELRQQLVNNGIPGEEYWGVSGSGCRIEGMEGRKGRRGRENPRERTNVE
jgi:hypothetical protein